MMKGRNRAVWLMLLLIWTLNVWLSSATRAYSQNSLPAERSELAQKLIVKITSESNFGAGIVVGQIGDIVFVTTANHVVRRGAKEAQNLKVEFNFWPEEIEAKLLKHYDKELDVAVLLVNLQKSNLNSKVFNQFLPLEQVKYVSEVTEEMKLYPVGHPAGEEWFVPPVSQNIYNVEVENISFYFQCDQGYSGGGIFDENWNLVGMVKMFSPPLCRAVSFERIRLALEKWRCLVNLTPYVPGSSVVPTPVTPTATPTSRPAATPTPRPTPKPRSRPTATPIPRPTSTPKPRPTATPTSVPTISLDFDRGSRTVYIAQLSTWPTKNSEHGYVGPKGDDYVLEATSNTWMGSGYSPITPLKNDFIVDFSFEVVQKTNSSLSITLSDDGNDYSQFNFIFSIWEQGSLTFSILEYWVEQNFYAHLKNRIAERAVVPQHLSSVDWTKENKLSVKREGTQIGFYLNGHLLQSFQSSIFEIKKLNVSIAFKSRVLLTSVEARVPQ